MKLTGKYTVNAPAQQVWDILMNPDTLARIVPYVTTLEPTGLDTFKAIANVKIGPVKDSFSGNLAIKNKNEPENFTLGIEQNSKSGSAAADMKMSLTVLSPTQTEVSFEGDVRLSGTLAIMGGRVLTPIAATVSKQFFEGLAKEVATIEVPQTDVVAEPEAVAVSPTDNYTEGGVSAAKEVVESAVSEVKKVSGGGFWAWLKRLLGFGS
jgi:uncharacterized protein